MGLQQEIWIKELVRDLFADNSFLSKAKNHDEYVNKRTVHIPNSGGAPKVFEGAVSKPVKATEWQDKDLEYTLEVFRTEPITVESATAVEFSYDKLNEVLGVSREVLNAHVADYILRQWFPTDAGINPLTTTGKLVAAHTNKATGQRKAMTKDEVFRVAEQFDRNNVLKSNRYMLLDATMYYQLLGSLTASDAQAFFSAAKVDKGVVGRLYDFDIMLRSHVGAYSAAGAFGNKADFGAATDVAAGLAWQFDSVARALGEVKMNFQESAPGYYGDVMSFEVRAGGSKTRFDGKGILPILQGQGE